MKKFLLGLFFALCLISYFPLNAQTVIKFIPTTNVEPNDPEDEPSKGHRIPTRSLIGYIDLDNEEMVLPSAIENIVSFELWMDNYCIASVYDSNELVNKLAQYADYTMAIVVITTDSIYIGYYCPNED